MVQDYAETLLTGVLAQFVRLHPEASLQARVGGTAELLQMIEADALDVALGYADPGSPAELRREEVFWIGSPELATREVLPLAVLEKPCRFRAAAIAALEVADRPFRIALETPNLSTLRAGVAAGLGLTCRTALFLGADTEAMPQGLPTLARVATALWTSANSAASTTRLRAIFANAILS